MAQWTSTDGASGSPKWGAASIWQGSGRSNQVANNTPLYNNTTVGAWSLHNATENMVIGQFGINKFEAMQAWGKHLSALTVTGSTTGFSNTDVINIAPSVAGEGTRKATASISTNSIGGFVNSGITITSIGLFANAETNATVVISVANSIGGVSGGSGQTFAQTIASTTGEATRRVSTGWQMRRAGMGPVATVVAANGVFVNGETATLSGGTGANGSVTLTTNATGNLVSGVVTKGGTFVNASSVTLGFDRQRHLANVIVTGSTASFTNTDTFVVSNTVGGLVNAVANATTNSIGGITNSSFTIINLGLFSNTQTNSNLLVTALAANGAASNGTGATFTATITPSTGGNLQVGTMGGRAGRVHYECTVSSLSLSNGSSTQLPS